MQVKVSRQPVNIVLDAADIVILNQGGKITTRPDHGDQEYTMSLEGHIAFERPNVIVVTPTQAKQLVSCELCRDRIDAAKETHKNITLTYGQYGGIHYIQGTDAEVE